MNDIEFCRWENGCFGYGYGTGEAHVLKVVKEFMALLKEDRYDFRELEIKLGAEKTWLIINALCQFPRDGRLYKDQIIEYGTSPRFGWLTSLGKELKTYIDSKSLEDLLIVLEKYDSMEDPIYQQEIN